MEQKNNTGALFSNKKKTKDSHPNTTGQALIDGVEYWIKGWTKDSQKVGKFISIVFEPKDNQTGSVQQKLDEDEDDIPF